MTWKAISRNDELKRKRQKHNAKPKPGAIFSSVKQGKNIQCLKPELMVASPWLLPALGYCKLCCYELWNALC